MVITGATGAIGRALVKAFSADTFDIRKDTDFPECAYLVNCMGVVYDKMAHKTDPLEWGRVIDINLIQTMDVIRMALPGMRKQKFGRIINLSSVVANMGVAGTSAYAASKAGLNGMIKSIAVENASKNVLINNLNLGYMDLGMTKKIPNYDDLLEKIPVGSFGHASEIISAIEFLIKSDYITGTCIDINGGLW